MTRHILLFSLAKLCSVQSEVLLVQLRLLIEKVGTVNIGQSRGYRSFCHKESREQFQP